MRTKLFAFCVMAALASCGGGSGGGGTAKQDNSEPVGVIAGRVLDAATGMPLVGVSVSTFANGMQVSSVTDVGGRYQLGPMAAGSYTLSAELASYVKRVFTAVTVSGAAGNFPTGNVVVTRDFDMSKADATIDGIVSTSTTAPANGATVFIDLRSSGYDLVASTKTDMAGKFKLTGLPGTAAGFSMTVNVAPFDENMDGAPDYSTNSRTYTLFPGFTATGTITISSVGIPLLSSNIADSDLAPMDPIVMTFGAAIRTNQSTFTLTRSSIGYTVGINIAWDAMRTTATITPAGGPLVEGQNYQLSWNLRSDSTATANSSQSFVVRAATSMPIGNVTNFRVTSPANGLYDATTNSVVVAWDSVNNAGGYRIYGKDTQMNPAYLQLSSPSATTTNTSVSLSTSIFGSSGGALLNSNKITLAIVAVDRGGIEGPLSSAPTVDLVDNTAPTITNTQQTGTANNMAGASPLMMTYRVTYSEPMQQNTSPTLQPNDGRVTSTFMWSSATLGIFTVTIPPTVNGAGALQVSGGRDTSNNLQDGGYIGSIN